MKNKHCEEHFNMEAWLLPYADMITLMLAFFIIMYALGLEDTSKTKQFSESIRIALGLPELVQPGGKTPPVPYKSTDGKYKKQNGGSKEKSKDKADSHGIPEFTFNGAHEGITAKDLGKILGLKEKILMDEQMVGKKQKKNEESASDKASKESSEGSGGKTAIEEKKFGGKDIDKLVGIQGKSLGGNTRVLEKLTGSRVAEGKIGKSRGGKSESGKQIAGQTTVGEQSGG